MGTSPRHIAILQTAFLGDTLLSIPLAKELKRRGYLLTLLCRAGLAEVFRATSLFAHVIEIEKGEASSYQSARRKLHNIWKDADTRILLSPHESHRSKFFGLKLRLSQEATETIGFRDRSFAIGLSRMAYTHLVDRPMNLPEALRQMALLTASCFEKHEVWSEKLATYDRSQGLSGGRDLSGSLLSVPDWASMRVELSKDAKTDSTNEATTVPPADAVARPARNMAILAPGSVWKTKQWTEEGFVEVGKKLTASHRHVVITGSRDEAELCQRIASKIGDGATSRAGVLSLLETAHVMAKSDVAVVNDSGSMHLAALVGTPTVAIFGPTVLDFGYRPWSEVANVVEPSEPLSCRPCGLHGSQVCPIGTHICMKNTTATQVWQKIETLLARET